jgi:hypothetical protein
MTLRQFTISDFEEVADMHYAFITEVFSDKRKISPKYFFYKEVQSWIANKKHIVLACKDKKIVGYSMSYIDEFNGLTEPIYTCEVAYVKPEHRKSRAAYMLYKNGYNVGMELGMNINTSGRVVNGVSSMMKKHFNLEEQFINFEGVNDGKK